ncbi:T9SS type A sorting domain-containing protein [Gemmatimonas aurantiaca]|nr:T9SS type A sorting domain-containing protein [Gemmatimonas aurantiaca]
MQHIAMKRNHTYGLYQNLAFLVALLVFGVCLGLPQNARAKSTITPTDRLLRHQSQLEYFHSGVEVRPYDIEASSAGAAFLGPYFSTTLSEDLRLSESIAPGRFLQSDPNVAVLDDGSIIVAWVDERQGAGKIYLQKFNANGVSVGANVKVAERTDGEGLLEPRVVSTISSKFYLAFRDPAAGEIRGLRYNADLTIDLAEFVISDAVVSGYAGLFDIDARFTGELVVAYESYTVTNEIHLRRFLADGSANGGVVSAIQTANSASRWAPSVTYDDEGGFAVSWEDYTSGVSDIYFRRFDSLSEALTDELNLIDSDSRSAGQYLPSLAFSSIHGFVTGFSDTRAGWKVYLQRFSKQIGLVGANLRVSAADSALYTDPVLAISPSGLLTVLYCKYSFTASALAQRFDASLAFIGAPKIMNQLTDGALFEPTIDFSQNGDHSFGWSVQLSGDKDARLFVTDASLNALTSVEVTVNDDSFGAVSDQPALSLMQGVRVLTAFRDQRFDAGDIFLQVSTLEGTLYGANVLVNQDDPNTGTAQSQPAIATNDDNFLIVWLDNRRVDGVDGSRIYARYGDNTGALSGSEVLISGESVVAKSDPQVALSASGIAFISWIDYRNNRPQVFARILNASRQFQSPEFPVSSVADDKNVTAVSVAVDSLHRFHVFWLDQDPTGAEIRSKVYADAGSQLASASFTSDQAGVTIEEFDATVVGSGVQLLAWIGADASASTTALYLTSQSDIGSTVDATIEVTDNLNAGPVSPSVSADDSENILLAWVDARAPERRVYTQVFGAGLIPQGANQPLSLAGAPTMFAPDAIAVRGRSWVTWADARADGMNVYLNSFVHFPTDVDDDDSPALPEDFALAQNYPNPFNPSTSISFSLPKASNVTLTIYDITGRTVRTLLSEYRSAGFHTLLWDSADENGSKVASGVYLYRLRAGHAGELVASRKMTLLK